MRSATRTGVIVVSPEYRSILGGLKNAIDWASPDDTGHAINPAHCAGPRVGKSIVNGRPLSQEMAALAYDHTVKYYIYYLRLKNTSSIR
jgi:NAD(P)H-dependent FMN reductase